MSLAQKKYLIGIFQIVSKEFVTLYFQMSKNIDPYVIDVFLAL